RSSASTSVPMPVSAVSGPTKMPPPLAKCGRLFAMRFGLPAPRAVLDGRRLTRSACRPRVLRRGHGSDADRLLDARPRLRLVLGFRLLGFLLTLLTPAQAARGIKVSGGGSGGTHGFFFPFGSDRHPGRSLLKQFPVRPEHAVGAIEAAGGQRALQHRAEQVDERERA